MKRLLKGSYYKIFFTRILYVFILFSLTRILFFVFNHQYFQTTLVEFLKILFYGLLFDLSAIIAFYSIFIFFSIIPFHLKHSKEYQKFLQFLFTISTAIVLAGNLLDCEYFKFTQSRTIADIFNVLGLGSDFTSLLPQYVKDFWYLFLVWILLIILTWIFFSKTKIIADEISIKKKIFSFYLKETLIFILISGISIVGFRGGFQLRPISIMTAGQYTSTQNVALVLNTPFTIIKTIGKTGVKNIKYFDDKELKNIFSPIHNYKKDTAQKKLNVVIIILESFSKEYIGALNKELDNGKYKGYTPFLDSLINHSLVFTNAFANGKRSIEGVPSVLASIPSLMNDAFITSVYSGNKFNSIASLLKGEGYTSSFFHGGTNGTMGFDAFINSAGFDKYYGRTEYNNEKDFDGKWGICDEEFLQYTATTLDHSSKPFIAGIFSLSSHHPYNIPVRYKNKFKGGKLPILKSIQYTDYALNRFFKTLSEKSWFDNTIFVITADHTSESQYPEYQTRCGMYRIPIIFYRHNSDLKGECKTITQQVDIMPSVLDYLNFDKNFISYGESVFDSTHKHYAISYVNETYQVVMNDYVLVFDGNHALSLYNHAKDKLLTNNIINKNSIIKKEIEQHVKGIIQVYNSNLIENKMTIKELK
ncbi:MAG TPA: sulfatase-like hydrolase/transferase [Bacteroidales bacterium]|nr:sulfatase-like hydrolase/transferase [Bacteroidales bacterium]HPS16950.1 sulfatase-like hydrolase/transferase [Bacteroidales bacterium]